VGIGSDTLGSAKRTSVRYETPGGGSAAAISVKTSAVVRQGVYYNLWRCGLLTNTILDGANKAPVTLHCAQQAAGDRDEGGRELYDGDVGQGTGRQVEPRDEGVVSCTTWTSYSSS